MSTVKESLRSTIELLNDEEAHQTLTFIECLQKKKAVSQTLTHLASDPAFKVPSEGLGCFRTVQPIQGTGIPASQLLVEDRR